MPDAGDAGYLIEFLLEIGPANSGQSGPEPISWPDILAWQQATQTELTGQELVQLRELSKAYCSQYHVSKKPDCPAPATDFVVDHEKLGNRIKETFRAFNASRKKNIKPKR